MQLDLFVCAAANFEVLANHIKGCYLLIVLQHDSPGIEKTTHMFLSVETMLAHKSNVQSLQLISKIGFS
jgi:hypothetical protein